MSDSGTSEEGTNARRPPSREPHNEFILVLEALAAATDASTERADSLQGYVRLLEIENEKLRRKNVAALSAASWRRTHRRGCALTAVRATATHGGKTSPSETQLPGRANQTNVVWSIAISLCVSRKPKHNIVLEESYGPITECDAATRTCQ